MKMTKNEECENFSLKMQRMQSGELVNGSWFS
jgi:hypothetical protein